LIYLARQISYWKEISSRSVEGQAGRGDARYLYYQQIRGGAMGSPFTMRLANIYMLKWEQPLITHQKRHNELYVRYIDDVFMTSNLPLDQINLLLDEADQKR
jgi:hypothetical protein